MDRTVPPGAALLLDFIRVTETGRSDTELIRADRSGLVDPTSTRIKAHAAGVITIRCM
ncbi:hypothetical protein GCM10011491_28650 [Brucella endophytica]|uniref:Uncharacterized protein n=1 Tax=Brucella endophytica TaxID=1963359 RepID=A0A916WHP2_9HYPH|nr:hypothetical protein GCM10011491_28650 [Brucella endophytica]